MIERKTIIAWSLVVLAGSGLAAVAQDATADLPRDAKPGYCYARVLIPAVYDAQTERVLRQDAGEKIEVTPARYDYVEQKVMVKEASSRLEVVPARYEWREEKVLIKPAQTVWKKGRGPIEKVDNGTGEIMCLVEEPAVYRTIRKRVLVESATTRKIEIPAEYQTVKVRKLVAPASERRVTIPAEYDTVTKKVLASDSRLIWKPVMCQTNMSRQVVTQLQRALKNAGQNPGPIDGIVGRMTLNAVEMYQKAKGLATGGLTKETLNALNVRVN